MKKYLLTASLVLLAAPAAFAAETEEAATATPFAGTIFQSAATLIVFGTLLAILYKYAWGPILTGLQDREKKIRQDLEQAEQANREAHDTLGQYKQQLADARKEAQRMIEQSRTEASRAAAQIKDEAQQEITQMRRRAEQEIGNAKEQAIADLYEQTATLATQVASQILQREINADDQRALVEQSLTKLGQTQQV
ncbi:MAG: F0F1 ATP synthase subunit B [Phycisphaeraceae bacterium]